ncbi:MAG: hypothetical protein JWO30_2073 [Fibrobacteres bacterium]|nr:hypothetical protein [Fibrobacterota bacterium]
MRFRSGDARRNGDARRESGADWVNLYISNLHHDGPEGT